MASIYMTISQDKDHQRAELPDDIPMLRLIPALVTALNRPSFGQNGHPINYHLYHNGREIGPEQTLKQAGASENGELKLTVTEAVSLLEPSQRRGPLQAKIRVLPDTVEIPIASSDDFAQSLIRYLGGARRIEEHRRRHLLWQVFM